MFLNDVAPSVRPVMRVPEAGKQNPSSNYIALALVERNTLPDIGGANYTPLAGGTAGPITTVPGLITALREQAIAGRAYFFGNYTVNGKKSKVREMEQAVTFGTRTKRRKTGAVEGTLEFTFLNFYYNTRFFNQLRSGINVNFDVYAFTNRSVEILRFDQDEIVFEGIGNEVTGDITQDILGSASISYVRDNGDIEPVFSANVLDQPLNLENLRFTFTAAVAPTGGLQLVAGSTDQYRMTAGAGGAFTRVVNETYGSPRYSIFKNTNDPIPGTEPVSINTLTGAITVGNTLAVGRYFYTVVAENLTGVFGKYTFSIDVQ